MLRRVAERWRSSTMAAPRAVARDSAVEKPRSATGESLGSVKLTELPGRATSCAGTTAAPRMASASARNGTLLRINVIDRDVAGLRIHVTSPHISLRAHG